MGNLIGKRSVESPQQIAERELRPAQPLAMLDAPPAVFAVLSRKCFSNFLNYLDLIRTPGDSLSRDINIIA
jgi:hypothetical protein